MAAYYRYQIPCVSMHTFLFPLRQLRLHTHNNLCRVTTVTYSLPKYLTTFSAIFSAFIINFPSSVTQSDSNGLSCRNLFALELVLVVSTESSPAGDSAQYTQQFDQKSRDVFSWGPQLVEKYLCLLWNYNLRYRLTSIQAF